MYRTPRDGEIDIMRWKRDTGIQYRHEKKEDVTGFIPKLIARPEYSTFSEKGDQLQNQDVVFFLEYLVLYFHTNYYI